MLKSKRTKCLLSRQINRGVAHQDGVDTDLHLRTLGTYDALVSVRCDRVCLRVTHLSRPRNCSAPEGRIIEAPSRYPTSSDRSAASGHLHLRMASTTVSGINLPDAFEKFS